jgi:hypothetical protein
MVLDKTQEHQKHRKGLNFLFFILKKNNTCQNASKIRQTSHCHVNGKKPG